MTTTTAPNYISSVTATLLSQGFTRSPDSFKLPNGSELTRMFKRIQKFLISVEVSNFVGISDRGDLFEVSLFANEGKTLQVSYSGTVAAASRRGTDVFSIVTELEKDIALGLA